MVMLRTNSLHAAILYHFINNLTAFVVFEILHARGIITDGNLVWIVICSIVVFIVSIFIFKLVTPNAPKNSQSKNAGQLLVSNIFSIPILLSIIISVVIQYFRFLV